MNEKQIIIQLKEIFEEIFDDNLPEFNKDFSQNDIEEWDSLANIQLIVGVEKQFNIHFTSSEVEEVNSVRNLINAIETKLH